MFFSTVRAPLNESRDKARDFMAQQGLKPRVLSLKGLGAFFGSIPDVAKLIADEPEILFFAIVQWLVIWLAYLAWTQMLHWIPDQVWDTIRNGSHDDRKGAFTLINLALLAWSFLIVCVASYPVGICNAAMVAVNDLRKSGEKVTLARCIAIADRHLHKIWMFTVVDSWITVRAILDRLPKKNNHHNALDELLYYAWKITTMGVVPALVNGRNFLAAGRDSFQLLTAQPARAVGLRMGYSAVCWAIGVATYIAAIVVYAKFGSGLHGANYVYNAYFLMAAPTFVAIGLVAVLVRPFFLLAVAKFYTELVDVKPEIEQDIATLPRWEGFVFSWEGIVFLWFVALVAAAVFFPDATGVTALIDRLAHADLVKLGGQ